jgi:hypothetical protein
MKGRKKALSAKAGRCKPELVAEQEQLEREATR